MKLFFKWSFLYFFLLAPFAHAEENSVVNPKTYHSSISDEQGFLTNPEKESLNTLLDELKKKHLAEGAILIVSEIPEGNLHVHATEVFNQWGIGDKKSNNGFLLYLAPNQHKWELVTGYGLEANLPDVICKTIGDEKMLPFFKNKQWYQGLKTGIQEIELVLGKEGYKETLLQSSSIITSTKVTYGILLFGLSWLVYILFRYRWLNKNNQFRKEWLSLTEIQKSISVEPSSRLFWIVYYAGLPILVLPLLYFIPFSPILKLWSTLAFLYVFMVGSFVHLRNSIAFKIEHLYSRKGEKWKNYEISLYNWGTQAFFMPIPFLFYFLYMKKWLKDERYKPFHCPDCGELMQFKTDMASKEAVFPPWVLMEMQLKHSEWDLWACSNKHTHGFGYPSFMYKYYTCPECKHATMAEKRTPIHQNADGTYAYKKTLTCQLCSYEATSETRIYGDVTKNSDGSYKQKSSSSSSGFGGGSSGGGGSGGSW